MSTDQILFCASVLTLTCSVVTAQDVTVEGGGAPPSPPSEAAVSLREGNWKDVESLVRMQRGKIVVVDIWSMSCLPCISEFPKLVELQQRYRDDVVCISFNVDYVGIKSRPVASYRERVEKFLTERKAEFPNFISVDEADAVFAQLKLTSIPAVYVFGRDGRLAKRFDDSLYRDGQDEAFTYNVDIDPYVMELVQKPAAGGPQ